MFQAFLKNGTKVGIIRQSNESIEHKFVSFLKRIYCIFVTFKEVYKFTESMMNVRELEQLKNTLTTSNKILVTTHYKPDGDAIGSSLGLYLMLKKKGYNAVVVVPSEYPEFLQWLPGNDEVVIFENAVPDSVKLIEESDLVFCLDFNDLKRTHDMNLYLKKSESVKVMIDHHLNPAPFAKYMMSVPSASSTCEMVYDFFELMGWTDDVDAAIANCLFTGLVTDTGRFKFGTNERTFSIAGKLQDAGADPTTINRWIFDSYSSDRLRMLGFVLSRRMVLMPEYKSAYIYMSVDDYKRFNFKTGDNEGLVNYPLMVHDIVFSTLISETDDMIKFSFRSKGKFPTNEVAGKYFEGGGHRNASGGRSFRPFPKAIEYFKNIVPKYKDALIHEADDLAKNWTPIG